MAHLSYMLPWQRMRDRTLTLTLTVTLTRTHQSQEGGFVHRYQSRWFLYHKNCWLSYWKSPREALPLGVIDWRSVSRVGMSQEILTSAGDFQIEMQRGTSGSRTHFLRAKSSEARDRWVQVLLDGSSGAPNLVTNDTAAKPTYSLRNAAMITLEPSDKVAWKPIYSVPLAQLLEIEDRVGNIPLLVSAMIDQIAPQAATCGKDLFVTPGNPAAVLAVKLSLEQGLDPSDIIENAGDVRVQGSVLRKFLMDLPDPVCTVSSLQDFLDAARGPEPAKLMRDVVERLPPANETLLRHLMAFMKLLLENQEDNGLTSQILAESLGCTMLRGHEVYSGAEPTASDAARAMVIMMEDSDTVFQDPPLMKSPVFKNLSWKLLLVGRLLRVTPDDAERKLATIEEIDSLDAKLAEIEAGPEYVAGQLSKHHQQVTSRLDALISDFYTMEEECGEGNVEFRQDKVSRKLLREVSDHLDILQQEEVHMRAAFRSLAAARGDFSDRPTVNGAQLPEVLKAVGAAVGMGDTLLDAEEMFLELWYLRGEEPRPYTLPEFLDVVGKWMELRGLFRQADKYKHGYILIADVISAMRDFGALWGYKPSPFHLMNLLHEFDIDGRHGVTWEEFRMMMHRWIEERKQGNHIGKSTSTPEVVRTEDVLVDEYKNELQCLFNKFETAEGGIEILCLGGLFEEVCHAFDLGSTLSDLFRLLRVVEKKGLVQWDCFIGVMSKWIICKQLFGNYSKDGGKHIHGPGDVAYALKDLKEIWGCFDPRHGTEDVNELAREVAATVLLPKLSFEEFMTAMRFQVAIKSIFELHDGGRKGTLTLAEAQEALKGVEDYCGQVPACSETLASLAGLPHLDEAVAMSWAEFLIMAGIAVGDEFDSSS